MLWDPTLASTEIGLLQQHSCDMKNIATALRDNHRILQHHEFELLEKLAREAYGTVEIFERLQTWLPNIHRFALYAPSPLYDAPDEDSIDYLLQCNESKFWEVQHHGSGGGTERTTAKP